MRASARIAFIVPGALNQRTGGYIYDRRMVEGLRAAGRPVEVIELPGRFPLSDSQAEEAAERALALCIDQHLLPVIDGLALPAFATLSGLNRLRWVALVHHPLALETGLSGDEAGALASLERTALAKSARVIVTSPHTIDDVVDMGVPRLRITAVPPGTDPAPLAAGLQAEGAPQKLLCVATITPRKGHVTLIEALSGLRSRPWTLDLVGAPDRDPACLAELEAAIARYEMADRVHFCGELDGDDLQAAYEAADLFVLASHHEGYGMALAEALARGLPVVSTRAGAIPTTVPADAGLLVPPGDVDALRKALASVLDDPDQYRELKSGARAARGRLPGWDEALARFVGVLDRVDGR
ncbi:MAG: glycosyltransferase family 4 protein [Geminicoccaceae bacterium]